MILREPCRTGRWCLPSNRGMELCVCVCVCVLYMVKIRLLEVDGYAAGPEVLFFFSSSDVSMDPRTEECS